MTSLSLAAFCLLAITAVHAREVSVWYHYGGGGGGDGGGWHRHHGGWGGPGGHGPPPGGWGGPGGGGGWGGHGGGGGWGGHGGGGGWGGPGGEGPGGWGGHRGGSGGHGWHHHGPHCKHGPHEGESSTPEPGVASTGGDSEPGRKPEVLYPDPSLPRPAGEKPGGLLPEQGAPGGEPEILLPVPGATGGESEPGRKPEVLYPDPSLPGPAGGQPEGLLPEQGTPGGEPEIFLPQPNPDVGEPSILLPEPSGSANGEFPEEPKGMDQDNTGPELVDPSQPGYVDQQRTDGLEPYPVWRPEGEGGEQGSSGGAPPEEGIRQEQPQVPSVPEQGGTTDQGSPWEQPTQEQGGTDFNQPPGYEVTENQENTKTGPEAFEEVGTDLDVRTGAETRRRRSVSDEKQDQKRLMILEVLARLSDRVPNKFPSVMTLYPAYENSLP